MSHYTVLVIGDNVDGQLAPYSENITVKPYKEYWDSDTIRRWERILSSGDGEQPTLPEQDEPYTLEQIAAVYNERYTDESDKALIDDGGIYEWSTYNPKSKWDWYQTGGRWRGYFKVKIRENEQEVWHETYNDAIAAGKDEVEAVTLADEFVVMQRTPVVGNPGVFENQRRFEEGADHLCKGDVDIEGMRAAAGEEAGALWDRAQPIIAGLPKAQPWREVLAAYTDADGETDIEAARAFYNDQDAVKAVREYDQEVGYEKALLGPFGDVGVEQFQVEREEYVQQARDAALAPYAYVVNGEWHAPGKMGWFGMSSDTERDRLHFHKEFNEMFEALPDATLLTLVDCHI